MIPTIKPLQRGFTLIELLVVISIIAVLSSVTLAAVSTSRKKAQDAIRVQHMGTLYQVMFLYHQERGQYPCGQLWASGPQPYRSFAWSLNNFDHMNNNAAGFCNNTPAVTPVSLKIIESMPTDPINNVTHMYVYEAINSYTTGPQLYIIYTTLDVDTQRAQNDGGLCSKLYEIGSGVGVMSPTNIGTGNGRMECN